VPNIYKEKCLTYTFNIYKETVQYLEAKLLHVYKQKCLTFTQGCVRGQHGRGRGQGQGQRSSRPRPRPRPGVFEAKAEAKATKYCPRGRGQSARTPIPGLFTVRCYAESGYATSSVCPSLSNSTPYCRLLCLCMKYCIYLFPLLINHTQKFNVLRPDLEAKAN